MANTIQTVKSAAGIVAKLMAQELADQCQFVKAIDKESEETFGKGFESVKAGDTIYVNKPARFTIRDGSTYSAQDIIEEKVALTIDQKKGVDVTVSANELATDVAIKSLAKRVIFPAASRIAQEVERLTIEKATQAALNLVGTAGTPVNSLRTYLEATQKLDENLAPMDGTRKILINPAANTASVDALKGLFHNDEELSKQYKSGYMGTAAGLDFMRNNLLYNHANGTGDMVFEVRTTVSTEGQATLVVEGLTATTGTVKKGTVFTVDTVYAVHPITKEAYTHLQQFTVTADATADGSGYATLSISPAMYTTGGRQNISAFPADGDAITPVGAASTSYVQNLAFHPSAMRFCSIPLVMPNDVHFKAQETVDGITVRVLQQYSISDDTLPMRFDVLFGSVAVRPEWMCRLTN